MLAFAKSTLGELKDSLLEPDDSDDESPTSSPCEAVPATSTAFSAAAWPPGWSAKALESYSQTAMTYAAAAEPVCQLQGPKVGAAISGAAAATTANAPQLGLVENGITSEPSLLLQGGDSEHAAARETDASMGAEGAQPETEADVSACSLHTELGGPVAAIDPPELPATSSEIRTEPSAATDAFDSAETDEQKPVSSLTEKYSTLLTQHNALQQRFREMSDMQSQMDVLVQQVEAWRCAHSVAQSRVEALTLENSDLKEKALTRAMDSDERRLLLQRLQEREAEVKAASDALTQLRQVFEDGAGEDEARCARLEAELRVAAAASFQLQDQEHMRWLNRRAPRPRLPWPSPMLMPARHEQPPRLLGHRWMPSKLSIKVDLQIRRGQRRPLRCCCVKKSNTWRRSHILSTSGW